MLNVRVYVCPQDLISAEFILKLESLLKRAYRLQEEFEGALGMSEPSSRCNSSESHAHTHTHTLTVSRALVFFLDKHRLWANFCDNSCHLSLRPFYLCC